MKKRKAISIMALALASVMVFGACGGSANANPPGNSPAATTSGNTPATAATAATAAPNENSNFNETGFPIVKEKITLTALVSVRDQDNIEFNTMDFEKEYEEKTNIHVDFQTIKSGDWSTKLNLMLASGQPTDMILRGNIDKDEYGVTQKILLPLDDLIPKYMPIYNERLQLDNMNASIPASDGKTYNIGWIIAQNINVNGHAFINKNLLQKLSLPVPKTVDELTDVFRAFKADNPAVYPYQATFTANIQGLINSFSAWGIPVNDRFIFVDKNNKVQAPMHQKGFREALEWMNLLYSEGLVDPEFISQNISIYDAKLAEGDTGFFWLWRLKQMNLPKEVEDQYECILPVAAEGYAPVLSKTMEIPSVGAFLTTSNKYVPETLRWIDGQFELETMLYAYNGPKGQLFEMGTNGKYDILGVDNTLNIPGQSSMFFAPGSYYFDVVNMPEQRIEKTEYCKFYTENGVLEENSFMYLSNLKVLTADEKVEFTRLDTEILKYMNEALTSFITGSVTDKNWDEFNKTLNDLKVDRWVELYQIGYDRYLAQMK